MKRKICINLNPGFKDVSFEDCLDAMKAAGFDGVFTGWTPGDMVRRAAIIREKGLYFQSVHAPFNKAHKPWEEGEEGEAEIDSLIECIRECSEAGVPIVVIHPIIGMDRHNPTDLGIERFSRLVKEAEKLGIMLAFENVEGIEYLEKIIADLGSSPAVGYCWDTGHEMCYNRHRDLLASYGDRLLCTHLNDNLGIKDPAGSITFHDDLHMLPFDGIADWQNIADRLNRCGYRGPLTFELKRDTTLNGRKVLIYGQIGVEEYLTQAYIRACRVAALLKR